MLVMHIGPHKSATTYLQNNFYQNRAKLLERGWLYPVTGERVRIAHHDISDHGAQILAGTGRFATELKVIAARAKSEGLNILLSSEGFRRWTPDQFAAIRLLLGAEEMRFAYVIRDPLSLCRSMWAQGVRNGSGLDLPAFYKKHFDAPARSSLLNPLRDLEPLVGKLGLSGTILLYDQIIAAKQDIFTVFLKEALQIDDIAPAETGVVNPRPSVELTEFIRTLTPMAKIERGKGKFSIGQAIDYFLTRKDIETVTGVMRTQATDAIRTMVVRRDNTGLDDIERRVVRRLGPYFRPSFQGNRLFSEDEVTWDYYDSEALKANPMVRPLLDSALSKIRRDGLRVRGANLAYSGLIALRRWKKRMFP